MLLTKDEITDLTGSKRSDKQKDVLRKNGIPYVVRCDNSVSVTWEMVNQSMLKERIEGDLVDWSKVRGA